MSDHKADITKLPEVLQSLPWEVPTEYDLFYDGDHVLAAVPVIGTGARRGCGKPDGWRYEIAVVRIECDEDYFDVSLDGEPWGWGWGDVDFYVRLSAKTKGGDA